MRIHRLRIQAFGPFAGVEEVNFDELASGGLFLLDGPTGAGKSSILDAICYGIYGSLPGNRAGSRQIRSDHAALGVEPQVICELTIGDRRFEVTRSPAWMRPSKRGKNGTTEQKASSALRELVKGQWEALSTRNDEVGQVLGGLLGLDRDQFTKVVMLPQGGFADFLRAKASAREELLSNLFDTSDYAKIEEEFNIRLGEERKKAADVEATLSARENGIREEATEYLAVHETADPEEPVENVEEPPGLAAEFAGYDARIFALATAHQENSAKQRVQRDKARKNQQFLDERRRVFARYAELLTLEAEHERMHPAAVLAGQGLEHHGRAAGIRGYEAQLKDTQRALKERTAPWEDSKAQLLKEHGLQVQPNAEDLETLRVRTLKLNNRLAVLKAAVSDEAKQKRLRQELKESIELAAKQLEFRSDAEKILEQLRLGRDELAADPEKLDAVAAATAKQRASEELKAAQELVGQVKLRDKLRIALTKADIEYAEQSLKLNAAENAHIAAQRTQLEQSALRLAAALEDGAPCLVCGSLEHPRPARAAAGAELIDDERLEALEKEVQNERDLQQRKAKARDIATTKFEAAAEDAKELTIEEGQAKAGEAQEALDAAVAKQTETAELVRKLESLRNRIEEETAKVAEAAMDHAASTKQVESLNTQISELEEELRQLREGSDLGIDDLVLEVRAEFTIFNRALNTLNDYLAAVDAAQKAQETWTREREEAGFAEDAKYAAALLSTEAREEFERVQHQDTVRSSAIATLKGSEDYRRAREFSAAGIEAPSEEELHEAGENAKLAEELFETARQDEVLAQTQLERLRKSVTALAEYRSDSGPVIDAYRRLRDLAEVIRGGGENRYKMTLSTYVLAARLEEVAAAATERLMIMSSNRYSLHHDDSTRGNSKSGLGLRVRDSWTGKERDTQTLSGGETFMASLALALGLADVISHHSGAVDMQTLFVDEGFGSLDAETLEQVMEALESLRAGGRMIGLVSHVSEMKQRISNRVTVTKTQHGSTIDMTPEVMLAI